MWRERFLATGAAVALTCGCGSDTSGSGEIAADVPPASAATITLAFERESGSQVFFAIAKVLDTGGAAMLDQPLEISSDRGTVGTVEADAGTYRVRIDPTASGTGLHVVTASLNGSAPSATRTALVLGEVNDRWDQPMPVEGLVNTPAWEDGASISPDGQWLIVQYLAVPISCIFAGDPNHPSCQKAVGPVTGPERPRMPGAERVSEDGTIHHGCPSVAFDPAPIPVPPQALYGFRRQSDGSFAEPFLLGWDGVDGCISPWGPAIAPIEGNRVRLLYTMDLVNDGTDDNDLFVAEVTLGTDTTLGRYRKNPDNSLDVLDHIGTLIGNSAEGNQGNPHPWVGPDGAVHVFHDDEVVRKGLFAATAPAGWLGSWSAFEALPAPIDDAAGEESQPFFDGETLLFSSEEGIKSSTWNGGDFGASASWSTPEIALAGDPGASLAGEVQGVGEATIGSAQGRDELYFVFARIAEDGTINLDVGVVHERP